MEISIKGTKVQKVSIKSKYDDDKGELTSTLQADLQLHPKDIARIINLLGQKVPLHLTIGSLQAQFDLEMVEREPQPALPEDNKPRYIPVQDALPEGMPLGEELTRVIMLSEDAVLHTDDDGSKDFLSLHYSGLQLGPFVEICPPVDQLKKGVMLKLSLDHLNREVIKVELADPKDIADAHLAEQMEHDPSEGSNQAFEKLGEERDLLVRAEARAAQTTGNGAKPKRSGRRVRAATKK